LQPARDAGVHAGHAVAALEASGLVTLAATASPGGIRSRSRRCSARPRPRSCARRTRRSRPWPGRTGRRGTGPPRRSGPIRPPPTPWRPRASARERAGHATAAAALARAAELTPDADVRAARRGAAPALASVVDAGGTVDDAQLVVWAGAAAFFVGDEDAAVALHERAAARANAAGDAAVLPFALTFLAGAHLWSGRPAVAQADAEEAGRLAREAGQDNLALQADAVLAGVAALRGREDECRALAERARATARERGLVLVEGTATIALADLERALGLPDAAFDRLDRLAHGPGAHQAHRFGVVPTLVEAAARAGRPTDARPAAAGFAEWARATGSGWALPLAARSLALVAADDAEADALLTEALAFHDRHRRPLDRARTELPIGERFRRARRKAEARAPLRAALETFEAAGAAPWAERAREELRAAGAQQPRPGARRPLDRLTPQELQVARLVARGASNSDAAAALFLSPRTVEYHLHKVFRKLGLHARAELAAALAGSETG
jgi:DNA-binding CsgD family transcriptional regulator